MVAGRKVDIERRTDEVLFYKEDRVAYNIAYYGRTEVFTALGSDALWQIKRITISGTVKTVEYANFGKYNCVWDNRTSYFGAAPAPIADPGMAVNSVPQGISTGIKFSKPSVNDAGWTLVGGSVIGRRAIVVQNPTVAVMYVWNNFYDPLPALAADGYDIQPTSQSTFNCTEAVPIYVRGALGSGLNTIKIMEFV